MSASQNSLPRWEDYRKADITILQEIVRQGEARMEAQLQSALAADARAGLLASLQAAASAALFVAAAQTEIGGRAEVAAYISAVFLLVGALLAAVALRPIDFGFVGNSPNNWLDCIEKEENITDCLAGSAVHLSKYLAKNDRSMSINAKLTGASLAALVLGPAIAAGYILLSSLCG